MAEPGSGEENSAALGRCAPVNARTRGRPSPETAAQIDREILHAARDLFFKHGYESTSMAMIVKAAGVSKTTLYARYATKAELFKASLDLTLDRIQNEQLRPVNRQHQDLFGGLTAYGRDSIMISHMPQWTSYERMIFAEGPRFPELSAMVVKRIDIGITTIRDFIASGCEREGKTCRDPEAMAMHYVMALRGYYLTGVVRGQVPTVEECDAYVRKLVAAILLPCGS